MLYRPEIEELQNVIRNLKDPTLLGIVEAFNCSNDDVRMLHDFAENNLRIKTMVVDIGDTQILDHIVGRFGTPTYILFSDGKITDYLLGKVSYEELDCFIFDKLRLK